MKCPNCEKEIEQTKGKRKKKFCNSTCRSNVWQKKKRKLEEKKPENTTTPVNIPENKTNEPKEGSGAFFLKYGVSTWEEVKAKK